MADRNVIGLSFGGRESTEVYGLAEETPEYRRLLDLKVFCDEKFYKYPQEVSDYFRELVNEHPVECETLLRVKLPLRKYESSVDWMIGWEIDVADIPDEVKTIRVVMSHS